MPKVPKISPPEVEEAPAADEKSAKDLEDDIDEVDAAMTGWDGDPFFKDGKLYGQDFEKIKVVT